MSTELTLSEAWELEARNWVQWARKPGHDSYEKFHRDQFFELVPPPGELTVDIGCGEGRLSRHLKGLGHKVCSFDASKTMIAAAREFDPAGSYEVAKADTLPLPDSCADLAVVFMVLHDVDDLDASVAEIGRILTENGRACIAIVHPLNSAGNFASGNEDSDFIIKKTYLGEFRFSDTLERDGLQMTFNSMHRPLEQFSRSFERAKLMTEIIREHPVPDDVCIDSPESKRWQRVPLFMHFRLIKCGQ